MAELLVGDYEGRTDSKAFEELGEICKEWSINNNLELPAGQNGETAEQVINRTRSFMDDLKKNDEGDVLVVAHGGVLQLLIGHLCDNIEPIFCYNNWLRNCQLVKVDVHGEELYCREWGDIEIAN